MDDTDSQSTACCDNKEPTGADLHQIKISVDSLADKIKTASPEEKEHYKWQKYTGKAAIAYTAITAVILGVSAYQAYLARSAIEGTNRAWLSISRLEFIKPVEAESGPAIMAYTENVGRFPALDIKTSGGWALVRLRKPYTGTTEFPDFDWASFHQQFTAACRGNKPLAGAMSAFPSQRIEQHFLLKPPDQIPDFQPFRDGTAILVAAGCLTYRTFDNSKHTGFCMYATKFNAGIRAFDDCPAANFAE